MTDEKKQQRDAYRKKTSLNSMYFNRFLLIRYILAIFMFCNLYWAIFSLGTLSIVSILPIALIVGLVVALFEQIKLYRQHTNDLPKSRVFFISQLTTNCILLLGVYSPLFNTIFPFLTDESATKSAITLVLLLGIVLCLLTLNKIQKISQNQDKHFMTIKQYEQTVI